MTGTPVSLDTVDLENCAQEPIQTPGSIQPHGVLLAMSPDGILTHVSRNAASYGELFPRLGRMISESALWENPHLRQAAQGMLEDAPAQIDIPPLTVDVMLCGVHFDAVIHARAGRILMEFEQRGIDAFELSSFAVMAQRGMSRLRSRSDINAVLEEAVATVSDLTGFDRVMAYRFHVDSSGEVVAEAKTGDLDAYLGRRFPASDIPIQARRLYVVNTLRLIANVQDRQVAIDAFDHGEPALDMSSSILRSVSPIHVEYLKNIGVAASMSVSIVVNGELWGLIACHHRQEHLVPYAVRMACDVLANVVAMAVQLLLKKAANARSTAANELRSVLVHLGDIGEDSAIGLGPSRASINRVIACDWMLFVHGSEIRHEGVTTEAAGELVRWLEVQSEDLVSMSNLSQLPASLRERLAPVSGILAMRYDRINRGWVVLMRNEQSASITWSGAPAKIARIGPLGSRLTPDGSLAEWVQTVQGTAATWDELDLSLAQQIMSEVRQATVHRSEELIRARSHLLAILGHDLRDPLNSISMAASSLKAGVDREIVGTRISASTGRMSRLITQVLDMSRLHGGIGLGLSFVTTDLCAMVQDLVDESRLAYPHFLLRTEMPASVIAEVDRDRLAQAVTNLLGNARQHGLVGEAVDVRVTSKQGRARIEVANLGAALEDELARNLFDPLKRSSLSNERNPAGLGLGLYIASEAIKGHAGVLDYRHDGTRVIFAADFPMSR